MSSLKVIFISMVNQQKITTNKQYKNCNKDNINSNQKLEKRGVLFMEDIKAKTDMNEDQQLDFYENMFSALADKNRLIILNQIGQSTNKSLCVCVLEELLDLQQSKLSYHLNKLISREILISEIHCTWRYYSLTEAEIQVVLTEDTCCKIL